MKLKKKMLLFFIVATIIPFTCMTLFAYTQYVRIMNNHVASIADNQFANLSQTVQDSYRSIRQTVSFLTFYSTDGNSILATLRELKAAEGAPSDFDMYQASQNIKTMCQSVVYNQRNLRGIYVFTQDRSVFGHSRNSNGGISSDYDPMEDEWYQETLARNGGAYISPTGVYPMFREDAECFFIAHLIRDVDRRFDPLGVIVLAYSPEMFDLSQENALADMTLITLTNASDQAVMYTNEDEVDIVPTERNSRAEEIFQTPFALQMAVDYDSLAYEYNKTLAGIIVSAIVCLGCALLFLLQFTRSFINPVEELSARMTQKQGTPEDSRAGYENRRDEIGILYRQYYHMMKEINESIRTEYQNKLIILDSQMKALEARINSHFLFNTLESINSMAELAEQEQISTMSLALGHMFRYAIKTESELVTIREELDHVRDYMTIQRIRCDDRFQFIQDVPEELMCQKMLKLVFQPIVENSLSHGLEYGNSGDRIALSARLVDGQIHISISDNGKGILQEKMESLNRQLQEEATFTELGHRKKESIGLKNIQTRIELYYGKGYGLTIGSRQGEGTRIEIRVPVFPGSGED
mgnify:CR=1 FL=1